MAKRKQSNLALALRMARELIAGGMPPDEAMGRAVAECMGGRVVEGDVEELRAKAARLERHYGIPTPAAEPFILTDLPREMAVLNWRLRVIEAAGRARPDPER
jgi:hypothetical protein